MIPITGLADASPSWTAQLKKEVSTTSTRLTVAGLRPASCRCLRYSATSRRATDSTRNGPRSRSYHATKAPA